MADDQLDDLLDTLSAIASQSQEGVPAYREVEKKLAAALRHGDKEAEGSAHLDLGTTLASIARVTATLGEGDLGISVPDHDDLLTRAADHFSAAYDAALIVRDDRTARWALLHLGDCHMQAGRQRQARQVLELALHRYQPGGDVAWRAQLLSKLGDCALELGDDGKALEWYQAALELAVELGDPAEEATNHGKVASAHFNLERLDLAIEHYGQARDLWVHIRDDPSFRERIIFNRNLIEQTGVEPAINYTDKRIERASARLRLAEELPRRDLIRARHAGYYLSQLNRVRDLYESDNAQERSAAVEQLNQEWGQISQGQRWAGAHATEYALAGEQGVGYALRAGSLLLSSRVPATERQRWASPGLAVAERNEDRATQCDIHVNLAYDNVELGHPQAAEQHVEQAQRLARDLGDSEREGVALIALSHLCSEQGRYETAYTALQDGRRLVSGRREVADKYLANQVSVYIRAENYREGLELAQRDLKEASRDRDVRREAKALGNLGTCLNGQGDNQAALEYFDRALTLSRQLGDRRGEMMNLGGAGAAHLDLQQYDQAQRCLRDALTIARELDDKHSEEEALGNLALTLRAIGRYDDALRNFEAVREMARQRHDELGEARALAGMGGVYQAQERYQEALGCYERSTDVARQFGNQAAQAASMTGMGQVALLTGNAQDAIGLLSGARDLAQKAGARGFEAIALMALAAAFGQIGRSRDGLNAAWEAREIVVALKDQEKLEALDKLIPVLKSAADEEEAHMATPAQGAEKLVQISLEACRYLLQRDDVGRYRAPTEAATGPIPDEVVAAAERTLPRLRELVGQSQPEEDRDKYLMILSMSVRASADTVLEDPAVARLLASADTPDLKDHVMRALGMRVAIIAVAKYDDMLAFIALNLVAREAGKDLGGDGGPSSG
jgi:tetratricopeptide (TPR) repeat protein